VIALRNIRPCFEGEIPSILATAASDGTPNLRFLSHVFLVDDSHVALSNQFFAKTLDNLRANPVACIVVHDPVNFDAYKLLVRHERSETDGATFDVMRRSIDAIAALTGMSEVFALRSAEIFRVFDAERIPMSTDEPASDSATRPSS